MPPFKPPAERDGPLVPAAVGQQRFSRVEPPVGVGEHLAAYGNQIRLAPGDDSVRLKRVGDAADGDGGDIGLGALLGSNVLAIPRHGWGEDRAFQNSGDWREPAAQGVHG